MSTVAAVFASVLLFLQSIFSFGGFFETHPPANTQTAAVASAQSSDTQFLTTSTPEMVPDPAPAPPPITQPAPANTTYVTQPVIERVVERPVSGGVSEQSLTDRLTALKDDLLTRIAAVASAPIAFSGSAAATPVSTATFAPSQRINNLANITVSGVSGLTDSDIPDGITASNYLPLSGGTLTGTLTGTDLTLSGALTAPYFTATSTTATSSFAGGFTAADSGFNILQNGNVGIGTASPTAKLQIEASGTNGIDIKRAGSTFGTGIRIFASRGTTASPTQSQTSDTLGNFEFWGLDDTDVYRRPAYIAAKASENLTSASSAGYLSFFTAPVGSVNATERLRIDSTGNVGIGTTSPSSALSVNGFVNVDGITGGYKQDSNTVLYASTTNSALAVGASGAAGWMSASSTVWRSVAVGSGALATTPVSGAAQFNTALGYNALNANTTGNDNTASGYLALSANTTGYQNVANGSTALTANTTGFQNVAVGGSALKANTTGASNTANGYLTLSANTIGSNNVVIGSAALLNATSSDGTTAVGYQAGRFMSGATGASGSYNTLLGYQSGWGITTGARNVLLGHSTIAASYNQVTTGSNNIAIGNDVALPSATASNQLVIGNLIYGTGLSGTGATVSTGNIGIGTTTPGANLVVNGTTGQNLLQVATSTNQSILVMDQNGNIGLGTTGLIGNQGARLVVNVDDATAYASSGSLPLAKLSVSNQSNTANTSALMYFNALDGAGFNNMWFSGVVESATAFGGPFVIGNRSSASVYSERFRITSSGNVGIGTTSPGSILEVGNSNTSAVLANVTNSNSGAGAYTELGVRNGYTVANNADALRLLTFGTGYTTTGGFVQDGAALEAGANLSGGLSMVARNSAGVLRFYTGGQADSNERMRITSAGNVGIGTTTPAAKLNILSSGSDNLRLSYDESKYSTVFTDSAGGLNFSPTAGATSFWDGTTAERVYVWNANTASILLHSNGSSYFNGGNVGIGTTTPNWKTTISNSSGPQIALTDGSLTSNQWTMRNAGGVLYIATSTYSATSSVSAFTLDANGNLTIVGSATTCTIGNGTSATSCSSSDERLKDDITTLDTTDGLAAIQALNPVSFHWNSWMQSAGNASSTQFGLIAQQVQQVFPNLVQKDVNTHYYKLDYQGLIAPMIKAIQEIASISGAFKANLIAWLGSASNGIGDLFAKDIYATNGTFNRVTAQSLCAQDICVTRDQLAAVLALIGQSAGSSSANTTAGTSQAPVIEINGNVSSTISIGTTYADLGARITGPQSDLNLGITTLLDGATTTEISIDTSTAGTHTILYTVTSPTSGLTSSIERTVIVGDATTTADTTTTTDDTASTTPPTKDPINPFLDTGDASSASSTATNTGE